MVAIVVMALVILFICFILLLGWVDGCCVIIMLEVLMYCVISCWFDRGWGVIIYWVKVVINYQLFLVKAYFISNYLGLFHLVLIVMFDAKYTVVTSSN